MALNQFRPILQKLSEHGVAYIVVGGDAAVLAGAPILTLDLDVVHSTAPDNISRLLAASSELDSCYRHRPEFRPDSSHLSSSEHQLLMTRFGPLDVLGAIGNGRSLRICCRIPAG